MTHAQTAILAPVPKVGRYLFFTLAPLSADAQALRASLTQLAKLTDGEAVVVGLGSTLIQTLNAVVPGLHAFAAITRPGLQVPSTPSDLCCWLRGTDPGDLVHLTRQLEKALAPALTLSHLIDSFRYGQGPNGHGRDLTGYEDGTENPTDQDAQRAALLQGAGPGLDGSSFMAVQQWLHNLDAFEALTPLAQDHTIGRRRSDNEEILDAPVSAHVKRTAQEDFEPPAFVLRRGMPWAQGKDAGIVFVAFGNSFNAYEALLHRMTGQDDGVTDALFTISKPITGAYFWCPPMHQGCLDLRQIGL